MGNSDSEPTSTAISSLPFFSPIFQDLLIPTPILGMHPPSPVESDSENAVSSPRTLHIIQDVRNPRLDDFLRSERTEINIGNLSGSGAHPPHSGGHSRWDPGSASLAHSESSSLARVTQEVRELTLHDRPTPIPRSPPPSYIALDLPRATSSTHLEENLTTHGTALDSRTLNNTRDPLDLTFEEAAMVFESVGAQDQLHTPAPTPHRPRLTLDRQRSWDDFALNLGFSDDTPRTPSPSSPYSHHLLTPPDDLYQHPTHSRPLPQVPSHSPASHSSTTRWVQRQRLRSGSISPRSRNRGSNPNASTSARSASLRNSRPLPTPSGSPSIPPFLASARSSHPRPLPLYHAPETSTGYPPYITQLSAHLSDQAESPYPLWYQILAYWFPPHEGYEIYNEWQPPVLDGVQPNIFNPERSASIAVVWKNHPVVLLQLCDYTHRMVASGSTSHPRSADAPSRLDQRKRLKLLLEDEKAMKNAGERLFDDAALYSGLPALCVIAAVGRRWSGFVRSTDLRSGTQGKEELGGLGWVGKWKEGEEEVTEKAAFQIMASWFRALKGSCVDVES